MLFGYSHTKRNGATKLEKRSPLDRFVRSLDAWEARREHPDDRLGLHSSERGTDAKMRPEAEGDRLGAATRDVEDLWVWKFAWIVIGGQGTEKDALAFVE